MKALSIRQPWAWLICVGHKDIDNRDWPTKFRGRIYVHAGKEFDGESYIHMSDFPDNYDPIAVEAMHEKIHLISRSPYLGAIIGEVDIVGCVSDSKSPWFTGPYGFVLANPVLYEKPIPCKGRLRFFHPDIFKPDLSEVLDITP